MLPQEDHFRAFMPYCAVDVSNAAFGSLSGLRLAVKDLFDVSGYRTGCGCPLMLAESEVKTKTASTIQRLLDAGANFVGKTHTDELAWSLYGVNAHFGTPINPAAPDHVPGGSSSGSAVAVAANLADIGIGTDTGGSIRLPASFCGLWGFRPTHGRVPLTGCMELAESFDTFGFFTRDINTLEAVGMIVLGDDTAILPLQPRLLFAKDMADRLADEPRAVFDKAFCHLSAIPTLIYGKTGANVIYEAFRKLQAWDTKKSVIPWMVASGMPRSHGLDERYAYTMSLTDEDYVKANQIRHSFQERIDELLGSDGILLTPVVHDAPFRLDATPEVYDRFRHEAMTLLCVAGLAGLPQIVLPMGQVAGAPYGVSLIGPRGSDLSLIAAAHMIVR